MEIDKSLTNIILDLMNEEDAKTFKITEHTKLDNVNRLISGKAIAGLRSYVEDEYDLIISDCDMAELKTVGDLQRLIGREQLIPVDTKAILSEKGSKEDLLKECWKSGDGEIFARALILISENDTLYNLQGAVEAYASMMKYLADAGITVSFSEE